MDSEFYESAIQEVLNQNKDTGKFKMDENYWAFMVQPVSEGYMITFLDITSQQAIITNLVYTFLGVASFMLIIIFFISKFFANRAIKPVKEAFDKQKQFIADASHELKTPLSIIDTNVDVLLSNGDDTINNQSKWLHYIKSESERMTKLTNSLLYLTQVDYSDIITIFTEFNLSEAVQNVILTMEGVIFENNISLHYEIEPDLVTRGNNEQIKQVVMILLDNAIKYTNENGLIK
jgi:two-component system sensor histidine kinase CiaH